MFTMYQALCYALYMDYLFLTTSYKDYYPYSTDVEAEAQRS